MYRFNKSNSIASSSTSFATILPWCNPNTWSAILVLFSCVLISLTMKIQSNLDKIVVWSSIWLFMSVPVVILPWIGFAAAKIDVRELSLVVIPAFATEIVCCYMASWIATRSSGRILSNSSIQTIPPSAKTNAPPSIWNYPVAKSLVIDAVRPAADDPLPLVYTAIEAVFYTNFKNWDLAVEGSPKSNTLMSPLRTVLSGRNFLDPPNNIHAIAFFIS